MKKKRKKQKKKEENHRRLIRSKDVYRKRSLVANYNLDKPSRFCVFGRSLYSNVESGVSCRWKNFGESVTNGASKLVSRITLDI